LAFLLPIEYLLKHKNPEESVGGGYRPNQGAGVRAVIMEPTRELATQVQKQIEKCTSLESVLLYGGGEHKSA